MEELKRLQDNNAARLHVEWNNLKAILGYTKWRGNKFCNIRREE